MRAPVSAIPAIRSAIAPWGMLDEPSAPPSIGVEAGALTADRYLGRRALSRMYCTRCSSLVPTCRAVTGLLASTPA